MCVCVCVCIFLWGRGAQLSVSVCECRLVADIGMQSHRIGALLSVFILVVRVVEEGFFQIPPATLTGR